MAAVSTSRGPGLCPDSAQLFQRYGDRIQRYCLGRLRDREEAADAVQTTFLRVHLALERGVVPQFEAAWLYKIAHNVCLSRIESAGRRKRLETPHDLDCLDEAALAAPENEHEALAGLSEALEALPVNLRQAILLREWQGLSYAEIAEAMDTTVPAVETLLYRARRQLAAALGQSRRAVAGLLWLPWLRSLLRRGSSRVTGTLSGASAKTIAGAAVVALGGSGLGAAVVVADLSPAKPRLARGTAALTAHERAAGSRRGVARTGSPSSPGFRARSEPSAVVAAEAAGATHATASTSASASAPASGGVSAAASAPSTAMRTAQALTTQATSTLTQPQVPTLTSPLDSTPTLPSAPSVPIVDTTTTPTVPSLPVPPPVSPVPTTPSVTVPSSVQTTATVTVSAVTTTTTSVSVP